MLKLLSNNSNLFLMTMHVSTLLFLSFMQTFESIQKEIKKVAIFVNYLQYITHEVSC